MPVDHLNKAAIIPQPTWTVQDIAWMSVLTVLALALRLPGLDEPLWYDELTSLSRNFRADWSVILTDSRYFNNHILYSLLAKLCSNLFGETPSAVRLPALLFGVLTVPALYVLGRQLSHRREALLATFFLVVSYHHIWFSNNARGYTGLALGSTLATSLFIRILGQDKPSGKLLAAYTLTAILTTWIHLLGSLVVFAHALVLAWVSWPELSQRNWKPALRKFSPMLMAGLLSLMLYAPAFQSILADLDRISTPTESIVPNVEAEDTSLSAVWAGLIHTTADNLPGGLLTLAAALLLLMAGVVSYYRQSPLAAALLVLPLVLISLLVTALTYFFTPRFLFSCASFLLLIGTRGGFSIAARILPFLKTRQVTALGFCAALFSAVLVPRAWLPKQDFEGMEQVIHEQRLPGEALVCVDMADMLFSIRPGVECHDVEYRSDLRRIEANSTSVMILVVSMEARLQKKIDFIDEFGDRYQLLSSHDGTLERSVLQTWRLRPGEEPE